MKDYQHLPYSSIHADVAFNVRDSFTPESVEELADDIRAKGLLFPLLVRPMDELPTRVVGFDWSLIAGFRRHAAITLLRWDTVPCLIKKGLSEEDARSINFAENLERTDLSHMEVARGLRSRFPGQSIRQIAKTLKRPVTWVQRRLQLLKLPIEVAAALDSGRINLDQAFHVSRGETRDEMFEIFNHVTQPTKRRAKHLVLGGKVIRHHTYRTRKEFGAIANHLLTHGEKCGLDKKTQKYIGQVLLWGMQRVDTDQLLETLDLPPME